MIRGDTVTKIVAYESGEMSDIEILDFFAEMIKSKLVWQLQGSYGRTAAELINAGLVDNEGKILKELPEA